MYYKEFFTNHVLNAALLGWLAAQVIKGILAMVNTKTFSWERFWGSGGMPSSHSAIVSSLVVSVFLKDGVGSTSFALAVCFAFIVIYDATNVRYAVGQQAKILNRVNRLAQEDDEEKLFDKELKEYIGHTKAEVTAGILLGITVAFVYHYFIYL